MKSLNILYTDIDNLTKFITNNKIVEDKNILLQIFTGVCDIVFIYDLVAKITNLVPHIKIIGSTTDGETIDGNVTDRSTVLSFSIFEKTEILAYATKIINIVAFAQGQNIQTVAEYVENENIYNILNQLGVDYSQGYFFGKPAPLN